MRYLLSAMVALSLSSCSLLFDGTPDDQPGSDAALLDDGGQANDASHDAARDDASPRADAFDCAPARRLSIGIINPNGADGDVVVSIDGSVATTCESDEASCQICVSMGDRVSLHPAPADGSVFTFWNQCGPLCQGGETADPCAFMMPAGDVGCLANFDLE